MNNAQDIEVESLGDYKVLSYLRRTVWCQDILAEHRFIKKRYILKLLHPEMTSSEAFMNVFHEAVVRLATLKHSGIVTIENVSQVNGQYFLVTEDKEIPTCSLSQYLSSKTEGLGELEIYDFVEQLAQILDYVHGHGLVHGNLNLDSVHVDLSGNMTRIFLPELGFSFLLKEHALRHILHECPEGSYFTQLKQATLFQAPEIPSGTVEEDTYAFGVIVYFLLFRRLPQGMFPLPSEIFPGYLYDWDGLLHSCLHYSPEQRPKKLVSILKKKVLGEQLLNVKMQCVDETRDSHQEIENPQVFSLMKEGENIVESIDVTAPAFVLVEAKSIDEAMNTSLDSTQDRPS